MSIGRLSSLLGLFKGDSTAGKDKQTVLEELYLTVLGRATSSDTNIDPDEIEEVRKLYSSAFGKEVEAGEVRLAANSEIFESTPLESYVKAAQKVLDTKDKQLIADGIKQVIGADGRTSPREAEFFNQMVAALNMTSAELVGLDTE